MNPGLGDESFSECAAVLQKKQVTIAMMHQREKY